ncbi:MAG TPA: MFS transporter, partial [Acidimicrobiales bacterium]|nr:MFS transporter [Acidimicrobiales bacterium]
RVQARAGASTRHAWWVLWALLAGLFALNFTFTVFIVALPTVAHQLRTSVGTLTWTMVGPLLAYGLAAPLLGKVGDVVGHRRLYLVGLAGALVAAALTALSHDVATLITARTLDGVQGAATGTASGALVNAAFSREERVKALGWWSLVGAGGPVIGVSLGSPIIQAFGWRTLFWFQLALIAVALVVVSLLLPAAVLGTDAEAARKVAARAELRSLDWVGSIALSLAVTLVMLGLSIGPSVGWRDPLTLGAFVVGAAGIVVYVVRLRTAAHPLIPAHYFTRRNFLGPLVLRAAMNFAYFGGFFLFPLMMEEAYRYSVAGAGGLAIARPLVFALSSPVAGYVAYRIGERTSAVAGAVSLVASMALFATLGATASPWVIGLALALSGLAMGVAMPASSSVMASEVEVHEFGVMSAAQLLAMQVGEVAGIEVLATLQQGLARARHLGTHGGAAAWLSTFHTPFLVGGAVALVGLGAALAVRSVERRPFEWSEA